MKDRVFIGWSGNKDIALLIKNELRKIDYDAVVGGELGSEFSIGQAVINQLDQCNQAIMLLKKKNITTKFLDVSPNLYFEIGYALAKYGNEKIHCYAKKEENISLPSDFENAYVMRLDSISDADYVKEILDSFLFRQKLAVDKNKLDLFNDRYLIREMIKSHHTESKCSDYELAQYILFYLEAAYLFNDIDRFNEEIHQFKINYGAKNIPFEINISIKICELMYERNSKLKINNNHNPYLDFNDFDHNETRLKKIEQEILKDSKSLYCLWAKIFIYSGMSYIYYLLSNNPDLSQEDLKEVYSNLENAANASLKSIDDIIIEMKKRNIKSVDDDEKGFLALYRSHAYRNLFYVNSFRKEIDSASNYLSLMEEIREKLVDDYKDRVDTKIYSNFVMEYYLSIIDKYEYTGETSIKRKRYVQDMKEYLDSLKKSEVQNKYLKKISAFCSE